MKIEYAIQATLLLTSIAKLDIVSILINLPPAYWDFRKYNKGKAFVSQVSVFRDVRGGEAEYGLKLTYYMTFFLYCKFQTINTGDDSVIHHPLIHTFTLI